MSLCINPNCTQPNHPGNDGNHFCQSCGSSLVLQSRFRVMRLISKRSGFGSVYEAYERNIPKVLKILKPAHNHNAKAVQLFQQEARVLSELKHSGVPTVDAEGYFQYEPADEGEPLHCLVMEKIDGPNLRQWMRQQGNHPISEVQARKWLLQVAQVLDLVHQKNYFHRDIKPENIMLRSNGQVVLVDFGAARAVTETYMAQLGATGGMTRISSAGYTPPEQEKGQAVPQSDFYALGWTFIYLLTAKQPLDQEMYDAMRDAAEWRQFAPQVSPAFADLIDYLIAPKAVNRPDNTQAVLQAIASLPELETSTTGIPASTHAEPVSARTEPLSKHALSNPPLSNSPPSNNNVTLPLSVVLPEKTILPEAFADPPISYAPPSSPPSDQASATGSSATESLVDSKPSIGIGGNHASSLLMASPKPQRSPRRWKRGVGIAASVLVLSGVGLWATATFVEDSLPGRLVSALFAQTPRQMLEPEQTLAGHSSFVNALLFTPDGNGLISAAADRRVLLWNLADGTVEMELSGHTGFVNTIELDGSGQWLASGGADNHVLIWNLVSGELVHTLEGHTSPVNTLAISPNHMLASGSADGTVRLWNLETGEPQRVLEGIDGFVNALAISPNGRAIAAAGTASDIVLWDIATGEEIQRFSGYANGINTVLFNPNGSQLIAGGTDQNIYVWDVATGELAYSLEGHSGYVNKLAIRGDGNQLLSSDSDGWMFLWDLRNQLLIKQVWGEGASLDHIVVRSDWRSLATGQGNHDISLWDLTPVNEQL
ncbi:serine/threonine protein kinase [filamentous cyanobacterium LEGE 07170]|nr:serine/threonine protein kinase [filamentous cyanobacterium LEGE 07170]